MSNIFPARSGQFVRPGRIAAASRSGRFSDSSRPSAQVLRKRSALIAVVKRPRRLVAAVVALASLSVLPACTADSSGGALGQLQRVAAVCPLNEHLAGYAAVEESANLRGNTQLTAERLAEIKALATQVAACGGHLQVVAFSSSETAIQNLYDGDLEPSGAELNARLLKVPGMVAAAMNTVTAALPSTIARLPAGGTDVLGQLDLAAEYRAQVGSGYELWVDVLTDGISTTGVAITNVPGFTEAVASNLASHVSVPNLRGAHLAFMGIGVIASGPPAPTTYVEALTDFYRAICGRAHAATCSVVTNPTGA